MRVVTAVCLSVLVVAVLCACGCAPKPAPPPAVARPGMPDRPTTSAPTAQGSDLGEKICKEGLGESGQHIAFTGGSDRFIAKPGGCLGCHNEDGRGRTSPKGKIPAINYTALRGGDKPDFPSDDAVIVAVRDGKDEKGETLNKAMPRWALTDAEAKAMLEYLKVLDSAPPAPAEKPAPPKS